MLLTLDSNREDEINNIVVKKPKLQLNNVPGFEEKDLEQKVSPIPKNVSKIHKDYLKLIKYIFFDKLINLDFWKRDKKETKEKVDALFLKNFNDPHLSFVYSETYLNTKSPIDKYNLQLSTEYQLNRIIQPLLSFNTPPDLLISDFFDELIIDKIRLLNNSNRNYFSNVDRIRSIFYEAVSEFKTLTNKQRFERLQNIDVIEETKIDKYFYPAVQETSEIARHVFTPILYGMLGLHFKKLNFKKLQIMPNSPSSLIPLNEDFNIEEVKNFFAFAKENPISKLKTRELLINKNYAYTYINECIEKLEKLLELTLRVEKNSTITEKYSLLELIINNKYHFWQTNLYHLIFRQFIKAGKGNSILCEYQDIYLDIVRTEQIFNIAVSSWIDKKNKSELNNTSKGKGKGNNSKGKGKGNNSKGNNSKGNKGKGNKGKGKKNNHNKKKKK